MGRPEKDAFKGEEKNQSLRNLKILAHDIFHKKINLGSRAVGRSFKLSALQVLA